MFDFTTRIDRTGTGSNKWNERPDAIARNGYVPLSTADMEFAVPPVISQAIRKAAEAGIYGYTDADETYRLSICGWMERRHSWKIDPEWISCAPGVVSAIKIAIRAFTDPGDGVIMQPPIYYPFGAGIRQNNRRVIENPLRIDSEGIYRMDFDDLRTKVANPRTKLLLLCSPHNPVGRVWIPEELAELGRICAEEGVIIVADEIHSDIIFGSHHHTVFATLGEDYAMNCILCTAVSKSFNLAGLMNSNIIIPDETLRKRFEKRSMIDGPYGIPYFSRFATIAAYDHGAPWLEEMLKVVSDNNRLLTETLLERFPDVISHELQGTYLAWNDWNAYGLTPQKLERFMVEEAGLALDEGHIFGTGGNGFERWNLAAPRSVIEESLERLKTAANRTNLFKKRSLR